MFEFKLNGIKLVVIVVVDLFDELFGIVLWLNGLIVFLK